MKIGLTYDLRSEYLAAGFDDEATAEMDRDDTIDALDDAIRSFGHEVDRIGHARRLVERLASGDRWDLVFNIAEGVSGLSRESQVPAMLDVYGIPYTFSDAIVLGVTLHKGLAKHVVRAAGIPTPDFRVVSSLADLSQVALPFPLFVKPVAEGTSKGVTSRSLVRDDLALRAVTEELLGTYRQPVLVETYLPGRELTVGITGTGANAEVIGSLEVVLLAAAEQGAYSYENKKSWEDRVEYRIARGDQDDEVREAEDVALRAWRALDCRDGGRVDVRSDANGRPSFIEVNPLAGLNPEISDLAILCRQVGLPYRELIGRILTSALARVA